MDYTDVIHSCLNCECLKEATEASAEESGDSIKVVCGLCGRRANYPEESLNRASLGLVNENLRGKFVAHCRYACKCE